MSDTKFTNGEWEVTTESESEHYCLTVECGNVMRINIITSATDITFAEGLERKANAHLIAAAPEMYAILSKLTDYEECQMFKGSINKLLAKARGEQ